MAIRSGITRGFDLSNLSNRFILAATPGVGIVAGLVTLFIGDGWGSAVRNGFGAGGLAFLSWTIARELHPDGVALATVASLAAPFALLAGQPDLLAAAMVMLAARVVAGTTGRAIHWIDLAVVLAVAAPVAWRSTGPWVLTASALALAGVIPLQDRRRPQLAVGAGALVGLAGFAWWRVDFALEVEAWMLVIAALAAISLLGPRRVTVGTDRPGGTVSPGRVRAARGYAFIAAAAAVTTADPAAMAPVWVALAAIGAEYPQCAIRNTTRPV